MYRNPTIEDTEQNEFKAIYAVIKEWDINVPTEFKGYCFGTGSHVMAIMDALKEMRDKEEKKEPKVIEPKEEPLDKETVSEIDEAIASIFGLTKEQMEKELKKRPNKHDLEKTWGL